MKEELDLTVWDQYKLAPRQIWTNKKTGEQTFVQNVTNCVWYSDREYTPAFIGIMPVCTFLNHFTYLRNAKPGDWTELMLPVLKNVLNMSTDFEITPDGWNFMFIHGFPMPQKHWQF